MQALVLAATLAAGPAAAGATLEQAAMRMLDMEFAAASAIIDGVEAARPDDPRIPYYRAVGCWWAAIADDPDGSGWECRAEVDTAVAAAKAWVDADDENARAVYYLGRAHGLRVRLKVMHQDTRAALGDLRRTHKYLGRAEKLNPQLGDVAVELGLYDYFVGRLPTVASVFRFLLFLPGGDRASGLARLRRAASGEGLAADEARVYLGIIESRWEGSPATGTAYLWQLSRRYPNNPYFRVHLARDVRARLQQPREALRLYREVEARCRPGTPPWRLARLGVGSSLANLYDLEPARAVLDELIAGGDDAGAMALRERVRVDVWRDDIIAAGAAYQLLGRRDGEYAERRRREALKILSTPLDDEVLAYIAAWGPVHRARQRGDREAEASAVAALLAVRGDDPLALAAQADLAFRSDRPAHARVGFDRVAGSGRARLETMALAYQRLGQIAEARGERDRATGWYERVLGLDGLYLRKGDVARLVQRARAASLATRDSSAARAAGTALAPNPRPD